MKSALAFAALLLLPPPLSAETASYGLPINADGRLTAHHLLYAHCSEAQVREIKSAGAVLHELAPMEEDLALLMGREPSVCTVVRLVRGMQVEHLRYPLPEKVFRFDSSQSAEALRDWVSKHCNEVEVGFMNQGSSDVQIYWVDDSGERVDVGLLGPGEINTKWMTSFLDHRFVVVDPATGEDLVELVVETDGFFVVGANPSPVVVDKDFLDQVRLFVYIPPLMTFLLLSA